MGQGMANRRSLPPTESSLCVNKGLTPDGLLGGLAWTALGCDDSRVVPAFFKDHSTRRQETRPRLQQELNNRIFLGGGGDLVWKMRSRMLKLWELQEDWGFRKEKVNKRRRLIYLQNGGFSSGICSEQNLEESRTTAEGGDLMGNLRASERRYLTRRAATHRRIKADKKAWLMGTTTASVYEITGIHNGLYLI